MMATRNVAPLQGSRGWKSTAVLLLGLAGMVGARAALADPAGHDVPRVVVKYGDLNLATDTGTQILYRRLKAAARAVCPDFSTRDLLQADISRRCRAEALARAVHDVHSSRLAAIYARQPYAG